MKSPGSRQSTTHHLPALLPLLLGLAAAVTAPSAAQTPAIASTSRRLVVVAPEAFHDALRPFVAHKKRQLPAELISLEKVLKNSAGADDPEKLKRYLYDEWRAGGLRYVLLVGDVDRLPVRFMVLDRVTPAAFDYAFYPSDLYYGDVAKPDGSFEDWNARKDGFHGGYYGEVRGEKNKGDPINYDQVDYRPELAVGRWPVSTPEEVRLVAAKSISFEEKLDGRDPLKPRAALLSVGGWVDSRPLLDQLESKLTNLWAVEKRYYPDPAGRWNTPPPDHKQVRGLLNGGLRLLVHTGHGQPEAWEQCLSVRDLDALDNSGSLPIVMSAGCSTAYFAPLPPYDAYVDVFGKEHAGTDHGETFPAPPAPPAAYQSGRFNPSGLGEQMLKRGTNGAVAYIGCNTGSQPCALTLLAGFVNAVGEHKDTCLGDCWVSAVCYYYEKENLATLTPNADWYPPSIFFQGMKFMLFGDPSLRLY
jgi:hypothetical protein